MADKLLNYLEHGPPDADAVFLFHGSPGSRFEQPPDLSICESARCRANIIADAGHWLIFSHHQQIFETLAEADGLRA